MIEVEAPEALEQNAEPDAADILAAAMAEAEISQETLDGLIARQEAAFAKASQELAGTSFVVHAPTRTLWIQDYLSGEVYAEIPLFTETTVSFGDSEAPRLETETWEPWGTAHCCINTHTGAIEGFLREGLNDESFGLIITQSRSLLYTPTPFQTETLAESNICLYPKVHRPSSSGPTATAYDLYLSEDRAWLCISDREAGELIVIDTATRELRGRVRVRPPGSLKAINLAFDYYEPKLFITDSQTNQLFVLGLEDLQLETLMLGAQGQIFGNLVRSPDIRYLCLLVLKPVPGLHYVNIESEDFDESINLKGGLFSQQQFDPTDLMLLTPDQNHLLLVTSHNDPSPLTPAISVIDPHQFQPLRFQPIAHALRDHTKPAALVYAFPNPTLGLQKTPLELLQAEGLLNADSIETARRKVIARHADPVSLSPEVVDLDGPDAPTHGQGAVPSLSPQEADALSLDPAVAVPAIVFALSQKLYQQSEVELSAHPTEQSRFQQLAEGFRQSLESHDAVEIRIEDILGKYTLEAYLTRQDILSLIAKGALKSEGVVRPPHACPACSKPLRGNWDCPFCNLELESPQRLAKKQESSLDALGAVQRFQVLVTDPKRRRLLILDDNKTIDWELAGPEIPGQAPWNALWLPNQNLLVVDKEASQVFECSPGGTMCWTFDQTLSSDHELNQPVKATYFSAGYDDHFLIVDQGNHRVLVVNRKQQIIWQYGQKGLPGSDPGQLNAPTDIQRTYEGTYLIADTGNDRVIEVRDDEIVRSFGPVQGLNMPVYAQRLYDRDTLVVDAGNYRLLELGPDGQIVSECFYYSEEMGAELRIDRPTRVYRREKKSVILMDEDRIVEILPLRHRLVWSSLLKHLARRVEIQRDAFDKRDSYVQSFHQYRIPTLNELIDRLRKENRLESSSGIAQRIFDNLSALIDANRERERQRARQPQLQVLSEYALPDVPLYLVDRSNQQVVRIDRSGRPVWHFGLHPDYRLLRPTHVSEIPGGLLIADTHHDRVIEVGFEPEADGEEPVRLFGGDKALSKPRSAWRTLSGNTLVTDQGHKRLVEFDPAGNIVWTFSGREISYPYFSLELNKGTILYVDWALHVVKEITRAGELIWSYGQSSRMGSEENRLASPEYAVRLNSGATLIADTGNNRVLEVSPKRRILWEFSGSKQFSLSKPCYCQRLPNGHTLIAYNAYRSLLEVDREGEALWHYELGSDPLATRDTPKDLDAILEGGRREAYSLTETVRITDAYDLTSTIRVNHLSDLTQTKQLPQAGLTETVRSDNFDLTSTVRLDTADIANTMQISDVDLTSTVRMEDIGEYLPPDSEAAYAQADESQAYQDSVAAEYDYSNLPQMSDPMSLNDTLRVENFDANAYLAQEQADSPDDEASSAVYQGQAYDSAQADYQRDNPFAETTAYPYDDQADSETNYQADYQSEYQQTEYQQTDYQADDQSEYQQPEYQTGQEADYQASDNQYAAYPSESQYEYQQSDYTSYDQHTDYANSDVDQPSGEFSHPQYQTEDQTATQDYGSYDSSAYQDPTQSEQAEYYSGYDENHQYAPEAQYDDPANYQTAYTEHTYPEQDAEHYPEAYPDSDSETTYQSYPENYSETDAEQSPYPQSYQQTGEDAQWESQEEDFAQSEEEAETDN